MQKDLKIGLVLGLTLVIASVLWLATRPSLRPEARMQRSGDTDSRQQSVEQSAGPEIARFPAPDSADAGQSDNLNASSFKISSDTTGTGDENEQNNPPDSTIYEQDEKIKTQKFHIVREGETLSKISGLYYGSGGKWQNILDANRNTITDANKIKPGMKLIIPN
jgi:nucleoid-associated protein YgaU